MHQLPHLDGGRQHALEHLVHLVPEHLALVRPAPRRVGPVDLEGQTTAGRVDVGAQDVEPARRHHAGDLSVEAVHVPRADDELGEAPLHVAMGGHDAAVVSETKDELRVARDLSRRVRQEIAPRKLVEERQDLALADAETLQLLAGALSSSLDARLQQRDRLIRPLRARLEHLRRPLEELAEELPLPVRPSLDGRCADVRECREIEIP